MSPMIPRILIFLTFLSGLPLRADLVMERQTDDGTHTRTAVMKLHGDKLRIDQVDSGISVVVDLQTCDSHTLFTRSKEYMQKSGAEVQRQMDEEKKASHGTNEMDALPAPTVDTGRTENANGTPAKVYTWSGPYGLAETLWVATNYPNYSAIQAELARIDAFATAGPHRGAQPVLSQLPGMVVKTEIVVKGKKITTTLTSAKLEPVEASLFEIPAGFTLWKPPEKKP